MAVAVVDAVPLPQVRVNAVVLVIVPVVAVPYHGVLLFHTGCPEVGAGLIAQERPVVMPVILQESVEALPFWAREALKELMTGMSTHCEPL